jgi:hypothetical protein
MTNSQIIRTKQALAETHALLRKEMSYSPDLQKQDMISFYRGHIAKLEGMLAAE